MLLVSAFQFRIFCEGEADKSMLLVRWTGAAELLGKSLAAKSFICPQAVSGLPEPPPS